jgi:hypothetical protein
MLLMPPVVRVRGAAGADGDSRVCAGVRGLVIEVRFILFLSFFNTVIEVRRLQGEGTVENMGDWVFFRARARALLGRLIFVFFPTQPYSCQNPAALRFYSPQVAFLLLCSSFFFQIAPAPARANRQYRSMLHRIVSNRRTVAVEVQEAREKEA